MHLFNILFNDSMLSFYSFILSAISVIAVVLTLKQNHEMLEASSRPYIAISFESITASNRTNYFVIKNYGTTTGRIIGFYYPKELETSRQKSNLLNEQFSCVEYTTLAPGQSILLPYDAQALDCDSVLFKLRYSSEATTKIYSDAYEIKIKAQNHIPVSRPAQKDMTSFQKAVVNVLVDIDEKML